MEWTGYAIAIAHLIITITILTLIVVSHTMYHERWLKLMIFIILLLVFIQHVMFDKCVLTVLEKQITSQEQSPYHNILEKILSMFEITLDDYHTHVTVIEGVATLCFGLELLSLYLR